jgi:RNA polymerase sigma-70 factor (ECF subfamily)
MMLAMMTEFRGEFDRIIVLRLDAPAMGAEGRRTQSLENRVARLYEELRLPLFRYLLCLDIPPHEAEELIQETFLRLHRHLHAGKREDNLRGWVYRVAHNLGMNLRKSGRFSTDVSPEVWATLCETTSDPAPNPEEVFSRRERIHRLHQVMTYLSELQRHCLYLRVEGFRYREIADIVGVTVSAVASALRHAMEKLTREEP